MIDRGGDDGDGNNSECHTNTSKMRSSLSKLSDAIETPLTKLKTLMRSPTFLNVSLWFEFIFTKDAPERQTDTARQR